MGIETAVLGAELFAAEAVGFAVTASEAAVFAGAAAGAVGAAGAFSLSSILTSAALNVGSSLLMSAFKDTPSAGSASFQQVAVGRQQMVRSSVAVRSIVYGQSRVSGPIIYATTQPSDSNGVLYLVIPLATHEVTAIDDVYFNEDVIPNSYINGFGMVVVGKYANHVTIKKFLGTEDQLYDTTLGAADSNWDSTKRGRGVAYITVAMQWNRDLFPGGIPNISALVRGKKLYDPRNAGSPTSYKYSANWALVLRDYLTNSQYGLGCADSEIDDDSFIAAANVCDERVLMPTSSPQSDALSNSFTVTNATHANCIISDFKELLQTGDGVRFTGASLPPQISAGVTYYYIRYQSGVGYLATSFANAFNNIGMTLSDGSGSMTYYDQCRYESQGTLSTGQSPMSLLKSLLPAAAGTLVWQQGKWVCYAGAYRSPVVSLDESDLRGDIEVVSHPARKELYNIVKGVYSDPNNLYQPLDFPQVTDATYQTEDGGEIPHDIPLPFTVNAHRAERIATIFLRKSRNSKTVTMPCKPTAFPVAVWDNVQITNSFLGWVNEEFLVTGWVLNMDGSVDLTLQQEDATAYDWSSTLQTIKDQPQDTNIADARAVAAITGATASSGTDDLFIAADGTVHSRIRLTWTAVVNVFVVSGGRIEIEYAVATGSPQQWARVTLAGTENLVYLLPVEDAVAYDIRLRAVNSIEVASDWVYLSHTVVGKTEAPSDVTGASALQTGAVVLFACDTVTDADLDSIEIRYGDEGEMDVLNASPIANILRGQTATTAALPPGTWEIFFRAKDTSGNYSTTATRVTLSVTADGFSSITSQSYNPDWLGTLSNMVEHWTGVIVPDSQSLANALGWEVFDQFVPNAYADCYFTGNGIDKSIDGAARVYADIVSVLGPGETSGVAAPTLEIDTRLAAGAFDGFESWTIGNASFRYLQGRIHVDTAVGKPVISAFTLSIDAASRAESGVLTVGGGGSASQSFANQFHVTPILQVTPAGSGDVSASYASLTTSGFTGYFKSAGVAAAGDISWIATGV